ncbi:uncharacterized protein LACBIDRAFT_313036 [Laccaria bicolor S238N-H82]|uniref:Predicted protein n=1 Tax=Laccaria bicolor (strain S238N-H82 / ATCC MYA-4686) TaxID=486041 RepID=B0DXE4_LACBS|nr:uncharacterized protein LACBIDRAFT_313036 [Laccaria bicolor S238N-H82]EDR00821.1 predicted protein [Laccaria bicolor S238N-H82]|eukprot:XP_001888613.1 predicted protein [Laccaria bicolor S238N-H82]
MHRATIMTSTTAKTTPSQAQPSLRRRMHRHMLDRAPSLSSLNSLASAELKILPEITHRGKDGGEEQEGEDGSPETDYESRTSSDEEDEDEDETPPQDTVFPEKGKEKLSPSPGRRQRPKIDTLGLGALPSPPRMRHSSSSSSSTMSPGSRAWYEFDLAVVVALVSPIGNWLTGGDHIKNLLLIVLLIFYLHQIIEIPWDLYQKSRPRRRSPSLPPLPESTEPPSYRTYAASELRSFELSLLFLTFLSPFLGALLLRYATAAVLGPQSVSWFSTGLFVLATGMRPWSHLVERIRTRTAELHDLVHYPTPHSSSAAHSDLERRVLELERKLGKMGRRVGGVVDEVYEYVDEAVDGVQHSLKKQEGRWEKWDGRVREVEEKLNKAPERGHGKLSLGLDGAYAHSLLAYVLPQWLLDFDAPYYTRGLYYGPSLYSPTTTSTIASRHHHHHQQHYQHPSFPSSPSTPLETIVEEDDSTTLNGNANGKCQEKEKYRYPLLARPMWITSSIIMRVGYLLMAPLRAVVRMVLRRY